MNSLLRAENAKLVLSGNGLLQEPISREALDISGVEKPNVLLIGTPKATEATFTEFVGKSMQHFTDLGANVRNLHDYDQPPTAIEIEDKVGKADVIWVSGGDTLRAMDFWRAHGIAAAMDQAVAQKVLAGGSAGMLAWLEQGHSDSLSYRVEKDEPWEYIFVRGLGYLAVAGCPHYDGATGDAEPRESNFKRLFLEDDTLPDVALGITNRAALSIVDGQYRIVGEATDKWRSDVHVITKTEEGLTDERLPRSDKFEQIDFLD